MIDMFTNLWKEFTDFQKEQFELYRFLEGLHSESFQRVTDAFNN